MRHRRNGTGREHGQVMILFALTLVVILAFAAVAIDLGFLRNNRQTLRNTMDAAALAGGNFLPVDGAAYPSAVPPVLLGQKATEANALIAQTIQKNYPGLPTTAYSIAYKCLIGVDTSTNLAYVSRDVPVACNPANALGHTPTPADFTGAGVTRVSVCDPSIGDLCNVVVVTGSAITPFSLGPVVGVQNGSTGTVVSAACSGLCGASPVVPVDLVVILDRTGSMKDGSDTTGAKIQALQNAAYAVLQVYDPAKQRVALGLVGPGMVTGSGAPKLSSCQHSSLTSVPNGTQVYGAGDNGNWGIQTPDYTTVGAWIPVGLSGTDTTLPLPYPRGAAGTYEVGGVKSTASDIVKAISCIEAFSDATNLATPIEMARWYLDHYGRAGVVQGIILETDGHPEQHWTDPKFTCGAAIAAATAAKADKTKSADGIQIFTIGYGVDNSSKCPTTSQNSYELPTSSGGWSGVAAPTFLSAMATDATHFYNNPSSASLAAVFADAAKKLSSKAATLIQLYPMPVVTGVSPTSGTHTGGVPVTISGQYFTGAVTVQFGGASVPFTVVSDTVITATAPIGTANSVVDVMVTTPGGTSPIVQPADQYKFL